MEEKSTTSSIHKAKTKKVDKSAHEVMKKNPTEARKSTTRKTRKKSLSQKSTPTEETSEQKTLEEEPVKVVASKIEEKASHPVVISSVPGDAPKTGRIGWWKRRNPSKN